MKAVTHAGLFHADDVFAGCVLRETFRAEITRTRDPALLREAVADPEVVVFDVGGVYDPDASNYDHHQATGRCPPRENGVGYSSAGLIWREFGSEFIQGTTFDLSPEDAKRVWQEIDERLVQTIDAMDCGEARLSAVHTSGAKLALFTLAQIVKMYGPVPVLDDCSPRQYNEGYVMAVDFVETMLYNAVAQSVSRIIGERVVKDSVDGAFLVMERFVPWQQAVHDLGLREVLYAVFKDPTGTWRVQGVPVEAGSFDLRMALPVAWAGKSGAELQKLCGVNDATFCHSGRFIAGAVTRQGALRMAEEAVVVAMTTTGAAFE